MFVQSWIFGCLLQFLYGQNIPHCLIMTAPLGGTFSTKYWRDMMNTEEKVGFIIKWTTFLTSYYHSFQFLTDSESLRPRHSGMDISSLIRFPLHGVQNERMRTDHLLHISISKLSLTLKWKTVAATRFCKINLSTQDVTAGCEYQMT